MRPWWHNSSGWCWVCRLTWGGPSPPWAPWSRLSPCSPQCEGRPVSSAETPGHPVDCQQINRGTVESATALQPSQLNNLGRRAAGSHLLAAHKLGRICLDLAPKVRRTDGLVVNRSPQVLSQLCKLWVWRCKGRKEKKKKHSRCLFWFTVGALNLRGNFKLI